MPDPLFNAPKSVVAGCSIQHYILHGNPEHRDTTVSLGEGAE